MEETENGALLRNIILATAQLLRGDDLHLAVERALDLVGQAVGADAAAIYEYTPSRAAAVSDVKTTATREHRDDSSGVHAQLLYSWSTPAEETVTAADSPDQGGEHSAAKGAGFSMTLPITVGDMTWGTLQFQTSSARAEWTRRRISVLQLMAQNFGEAIRHSRSRSVRQTPLPDVVSQVIEHAESSGQLKGGVAVVSPDGQVMYQNDALVDICGQTRVGLNRNGGLIPVVRPVERRGDLRAALRDGTELDVNVSVGATDAVSLRLHVTPIHDADEPVCSVCWFQSTAENVCTLTNERQNLSLRRRVRAERALVDASRLLVSSDACDFDELLDIVGQATGAQYAYLVIITPDDVVGFPQSGSLSDVTRQPIHLDTYRQYEWFLSPKISHERNVEAESGPTFAVPILSSDDQLFGYLGIEYEVGSAPYHDEDARVLSVLGDMLCTYLRRQLSEEALRRSEQRYRYFVDTIAEAIWRIDLARPLPEEASVQAQVDHVLEYGVVSEANAALADLFGVSSPEALIDIPVSQFMKEVNRDFLFELAEAGFELQQYEYVVSIDDQPSRYFVINTVGVDDGNGIEGIWGSGAEVTDRVVLERRMVEALERQQQRFGHDLHDRVSQQLAGTRMLAQNLSSRYFDDDPRGQREVNKIIDYVQEAAQHVSDLQRGVMPVQVDRDGLAQGLRELSSRIDRLPGIRCTYDHDGRTDVDDHEVKLQMYRIAQEATRNALTHGDPSHIHIELVGTESSIHLKVEDDGAGFNPERLQEGEASALGLHSMRYRAHVIGASLHIDSSEGEGTRIEVTLPRSATEPNHGPFVA